MNELVDAVNAKIVGCHRVANEIIANLLPFIGGRSGSSRPKSQIRRLRLAPREDQRSLL
jgi:hypothetical protein